MKHLNGSNSFLVLYIAISTFIIFMAFLPILNDIFAKESWIGHGWGAYTYIGRDYEVTYSDVFYNGDKPKIRVHLPFYFSRPIDLIEFSGHESYICYYNMIKDATNINIVKEKDNVLRVSYTYPDLNLTQEITITNKTIVIKYLMTKSCEINVTLWRWYYESVMNLTLDNMKERGSIRLNNVSSIWFTFREKDGSISGSGIIDVSKSVEVYIMRNPIGINKIAVASRNSNEIVFIVKGELKGRPPIISSPYFLYSVSRYSYPIIALLLLAIFYKPLRRRWVRLDGLTRLLLTALTLRIIVAPLTMHTWDINTIQLSVYQFLNGTNPYENMYNMSQRLRSMTGLPINYEGYAYLPHVILIFLPFYIFYVTLGAEKLPLRGVNNPVHILTFYYHPDLYLFLILIKLPLIITDALIVLILYRHFNEKAAQLYALSPYVIFITSMWGMFDNMVALSLLLMLLTLKKNRYFISGLTYGVSLMKFYTVYLVIPLFYNVWKRGGIKTLNPFIAGLTISQIPTFYFFLQNPKAFLSVTLEFHSTRVGGGVNPLNVLWIIRNLGLSMLVSSVISIISISATLIVSIYCVLRKSSLEKTILCVELIGILLNKIVNEQYFVVVYTLMLAYGIEFAQRLSYGYLAFALINTRGIYIFLPTIPLMGWTLERRLSDFVNKIYLNELVYLNLNIVLFALGTSLSLLVVQLSARLIRTR